MLRPLESRARLGICSTLSDRRLSLPYGESSGTSSSGMPVGALGVSTLIRIDVFTLYAPVRLSRVTAGASRQRATFLAANYRIGARNEFPCSRAFFASLVNQSFLRHGSIGVRNPTKHPAGSMTQEGVRLEPYNIASNRARRRLNSRSSPCTLTSSQGESLHR